MGICKILKNALARSNEDQSTLLAIVSHLIKGVGDDLWGNSDNSRVHLDGSP